jgi:hypothetical protein
VARLFEPYGSLLSRDGAVLVTWTPGPEGAVVHVAPRDVPRDGLVQLGGRLARALAETVGLSSALAVRRLTLRSPTGVAVMTPLDGGMLVAASSRPGAAALLEVLSERAVPGPLHDTSAGDGGDVPALPGLDPSRSVRVETSAASVEVLAPPELAAEPVGHLAGRLLAAIAGDGGDGAPHGLSVDLGAHRLIVHPIQPGARPRRYVAVLGGAAPPGLLGRRAERVARALREVS